MKKVVAVLGNDYHLGINNIELVKSIWNQQLELCVANGNVPFIIGGDMFTNRSGQPLAVLKTFKELIDETASKRIEIFAIPGNHDKTDLKSEDSYLDMFNDQNNEWFNVFSNAQSICKNKLFIHFIPFFENEKWLQEYSELNLDMVGKYTHHILITHMGIEGVKNNDGTIVSSPIKPDLFKYYKNVFIGHYHDSMKLSNNVHYTGSVYQNNFGENIEDKGFTLIYDDGSFDFVPSKFPKYIKEVIEVKDSNTLKNVLDKYDNNVKENYIRIVFKGKKEDLKNVDKNVLESKGFSVQYLPDEQITAMELAEVEEIHEYNKESLITDFNNYCEDNKINGDKFDYGLKLIQQL
jgi:exonuclease SbcD